MKNIILLGSGGHAKSVVDAIEKDGQYAIKGFLEIPEKQEFSYKDYKVIGMDKDMRKVHNDGIDYAFIALGFMGRSNVRQRLYNQLIENGFMIPSIIDPSANVARDVEIQSGSFVGKNAVVNANSCIGKMCIINTGAIVEHDCRVGDYTHIAAGAVMCGGTKVGNSTLIGANATIVQELTIGSNVIIGAGSVVLSNVDDERTAVGNPAYIIKREKRK